MSHANNNDEQYNLQDDDLESGLITRAQYKRNRLYLTVLSIAVIGCVAVIIGLAVDVNHLQSVIDDSPEGGGGASGAATQKQLYSELYSNITANLDTTVDPCDNFYQYACGSWLTSNTLPADKVSYSRSFTTIADNNQALLRSIAESEWPLINQLYDSCMDIDTINKLSYTPIDTYIALINGVTTLQDWFMVYGTLMSNVGVSLLFDVGIEVDAKNPTLNLLSLQQGGLSLPSASYYTGEGNLKGELQQHIENMLQLIDDSDASAHAAQITNLEYVISMFTLLPDQLRDPSFTYNPVHSVDELNSVIDGDLPWTGLFDSAGIKYSDLHANIQVVSYFQHLSKLLASTDIAVLKHYAIWRVLSAAADDLSDPIADEHFAFFGKIVRGQKTKQVRWKKCVQEVDGNMSDLIGRYFVEHAFAGSSKQIAIEMIKLIKQAFSDRLPELSWMDSTTVDAARLKLGQFTDQIGYTDHWQSYDSIASQLDKKKFYANELALHKLNYDIEIARLYKPVDKSIWQMSPPTVNAYYDPSYNSINFPAGILQPPFFDKQYPAAVNFGGIGMVAGHELTHGFDDQGRQYAGDGTLRDWWTDSTAQQFAGKAQCLVRQYSEFVVGNEHVNGNLTLGENIADNGGIRAAYAAWKLYENVHGVDDQVDDSLSNDKLFFLSYAQDWCQLINPEYAHLLINVDPHSPAAARVNYPLRNFDTFASVWQCKAGTFMAPNDRCTIW